MKFADIVLYFICLVLLGLIFFMPPYTAKAQTYNEAVLGHIITENIRGGIDNEAVLQAELQRAAYMFGIKSIDILESYLPSMLDGLKRDLQIDVEEKYKDVLSN